MLHRTHLLGCAMACLMALSTPGFAQQTPIPNPGGPGCAGFPTSVNGLLLNWDALSDGSNYGYITLTVYGIGRVSLGAPLVGAAGAVASMAPGGGSVPAREIFLTQAMSANASTPLGIPILITQGEAVALGADSGLITQFISDCIPGSVRLYKNYEGSTANPPAPGDYHVYGTITALVDIPVAGEWGC